jgi:hypothetical protein
MTMRVLIENTDQSRKLKVTVRDKNEAGELVESKVMLPKTLEPQEKGEVWLHSGRDCILEEI